MSVFHNPEQAQGAQRLPERGSAHVQHSGQVSLCRESASRRDPSRIDQGLEFMDYLFWDRFFSDRLNGDGFVGLHPLPAMIPSAVFFIDKEANVYYRGKNGK